LIDLDAPEKLPLRTTAAKTLASFNVWSSNVTILAPRASLLCILCVKRRNREARPYPCAEHLHLQIGDIMFAVTGITGKVGGQVARFLLAQGHQVRAVVRSEEKGREWVALGCDVVVAHMEDAPGLSAAFRDAEGVFLMTPPNYDPEPGFPETQQQAQAIRAAIEAGQPGKVVLLSTVGAHVTEPNLLNNSGMIESVLRTVAAPVAFLRAAWFMENAAWDIDSAKAGVVHSFLQPLDHAIPMVATEDIARTAATLLVEEWPGLRVVELEGPERYSADDIAAALASALNQPVRNEPVPRSTWESLFRSQGMKHPEPRMRMLDGFNQGWIDFESGRAGSRKASTTLKAAIRALVHHRRADG
jgi:NAD(P)H dehydrogenase (quinone)